MRRDDFVQIRSGLYEGLVGRVLLMEKMIGFSFVDIELLGVKPYPIVACEKRDNVIFHHREIVSKRAQSSLEQNKRGGSSYGRVCKAPIHVG